MNTGLARKSRRSPGEGREAGVPSPGGLPALEVVWAKMTRAKGMGPSWGHPGPPLGPSRRLLGPSGPPPGT
eukprot:9486833-Pyramimonas_sp.AAC.1